MRCEPWRSSPSRWPRSSPRSNWRPGVMRAWTTPSTGCARTSPIRATWSTGRGGWSSRWRWYCRDRCSYGTVTRRWPTRSARHASATGVSRSARFRPMWTLARSSRAPRSAEAEGGQRAVDRGFAQVVDRGAGELDRAVLKAAECDDRTGGLREGGFAAEQQSGEALAPGHRPVDEPEVGQQVQLGEHEHELVPVHVVEVEELLQQCARRRGGGLLGHDKGLEPVDQGQDDAPHQVFAGREVVVERWLGDSELVGDVLQARPLDALLREELARRVLDALLRV